MTKPEIIKAMHNFSPVLFFDNYIGTLEFKCIVEYEEKTDINGANKLYVTLLDKVNPHSYFSVTADAIQIKEEL